MAFLQQKGGEVTSQTMMASTLGTWSSSSLTPTSSASEGLRSVRGHHSAEGLSVRWRCGARLAEGSYGRVYRAFNLTTGQIFAAKVLTMEDGSEDTASKRTIIERLATLEGLRHPNIVEHLGHEFADHNIYVYREFVANGSLASMLQEFGPLRGLTLGIGASGLLRGLGYLHSREPPMVHGDVTSSNVFVGDEWRMQLQCLQWSRHLAAKPAFASFESLAWMAPEVFQGKAADRTKADVWGAGCVIMEMATAERPWAGVPLDEILLALGGKAPASPPLPAGLSRPVRACVAACLLPDEDARPSAGEVLRMPLLADSEKQRFRGDRSAS